MKKLFIAAMALATIVSCSKDGIEGPTTPATDGQIAKVAVSLQTRAITSPSYTNGAAAEHEVKSIDFYLFADGAAYNGLNNHITVSKETLDAWPVNAEGDNVTKTSDLILVLAKEKNTVPTHIVALINATETYEGRSLAELQHEATKTLKTNNGFLMSNSVYDSQTNSGVVVATEIQAENIFVDTDSDAVAGEAYVGDVEVAPIQIYVERVAAKVQVSSSVEGTDGNIIPVKIKNEDGTTTVSTDTFVKVLGWDITNATTQSYLLKSYNPTPPYFSELNVPTAYRSHWATTYEQEVAHNLTFGAIADLENKGANAFVLGDFNYYHENTLTPVNAEDWYNDVESVAPATQSPQLIVAAQLVDAQGNAKAFGTWYGKTYEDVDGLKAAMINNAAKQIFVVESKSDTETVYRGITTGDVNFYQVDASTSYNPYDWNGDFRHEVRVEAAEDVVYFDAEGKAMEVKDVNAILAKTEPAMIWTSGYTYYYTLIKHYMVDNTQLYGMVRNHVYDVNITSVTGFGTPVYDPSQIIVPEPPKEQDGFSLAAKINVLSWAVVDNNVELGN